MKPARPAPAAKPRATRLYHNPRCSKSRAALELVRARGIEPEVVLYLEKPPQAAELRELMKLLELDARALLRRGEDEYAALGLSDAKLAESALLAAIAEHPRLLERPIFVHAGRAVIGRPPERVLELLG